MAAIFVSYRRVDSDGHAGRLIDRLAHWYDADAVFYDKRNLEGGEAFPERLAREVAQASAVLVVIGPGWVGELNRRAALAEVDFVRREVEQALARLAGRGRCGREGRDGGGSRYFAGARVPTILPLLFAGASMPSPQDFADALRPTLAPLCDLNAHAFGGLQADWDAQSVRLRERLARIEGVPAARYRSPPGVERPHRVPDIAVSAHFHDPNGLLDRLREGLRSGGGRSALVARRAALHGMGGIGKTQLALAYCREYGDGYAGGVWWFSAETDAGLQLDALACCDAARVPVGEGELPSLALKRWLAAQPGAWLLVYDNAEHAAALAPHLPDGGPHHVVVTSRDPAWGGVAAPVELDEWTAGQGADFLAGRLPGAPRGELAALSVDLGGLPLALEQAASYVETTGCGVARYRELFASAAASLLDRGAQPAATSAASPRPSRSPSSA